MNSDEQQLIDFALVWQPFGGPPSDEILATFGITEPTFRHRVHRILATRGTSVDEPLRRSVRAILRSYLIADRPAR
ncbi:MULTISPECIES: hypothetical protein [Mycobacteriales]|uniref:hypothetical protein n=1 Tax=unclassified Nocardia TaxID=2637762 RepID=UPI0033B29BC0